MSIKFSGSAGDDDDNIFTKKKAASGPSKDGLVGETSWLMWDELLKPRDYNMRQETLAYDRAFQPLLPPSLLPLLPLAFRDRRAVCFCPLGVLAHWSD